VDSWTQQTGCGQPIDGATVAAWAGWAVKIRGPTVVAMAMVGAVDVERAEEKRVGKTTATWLNTWASRATVAGWCLKREVEERTRGETQLHPSCLVTLAH
jgi:hypothetical protein